MRVVVAGASSLGRAICAKLINAGHDVVLVDSDRDALDQLTEVFDCGMVEGDCTLPSTLREAGGETLDALLAVTNLDEDNILCALVGRSIGFERVIPQIIKPELCAICDELQLDDMITPHETVAANLVDVIEKRAEPEHKVSLSGDLQLQEYVVSGALCDQKIADTDFGNGAAIIAIRRDDQELLAADAGEICSGDTLVFLTHRDNTDKLSERLAEADES